MMQQRFGVARGSGEAGHSCFTARPLSAAQGVWLLLEPRGWLGWLHLPVAVFVWLYSGAWGDLPLLMMNGEMMSATEEREVL